MKAAVVFVLLFATVLCRPAKRGSSSSSESSEELVKHTSVLNKAVEALNKVSPLQDADSTVDPSTNSTASTDSSDSDESKESTDSPDSTDSDETDSSESVELGTTVASLTTDVGVETTQASITTAGYHSGRGDSKGYRGDDKKSIIYPDTNNIEKGMSPYKYYGKTDTGMYAGEKVSIYNAGLENEIKKTVPVFKALQVHELMEEDTSTPEMESQGLDSASVMVDGPGLRQARVDETSQDNVPSESLDEEAAESTSASQATGDGSSASVNSNSSEETTGTAEDSDSTESQESDSDSAEEAITEAPVATDGPVVITAK